MIIGIDPSQRNTGVCILNPDRTVKEVYTLKTEALPLLESGEVMRAGFVTLFTLYPDALYAVEKMIPRAFSGAALFYVQMIMLEEMARLTTKRLVHPLPVQLRSFMKSVTGSVPANKTETVAKFKALTSFQGRASSHVADAYFLALLGAAVLDGRYKYRLSEDELPLTSWRAINGS